MGCGCHGGASGGSSLWVFGGWGLKVVGGGGCCGCGCGYGCGYGQWW